MGWPLPSARCRDCSRLSCFRTWRRRRRTRLTSVNDRLVWIDCEMTGLDVVKDALIEIAALVTDGEQQVLAYVRKWVPEVRSAPLAGNSVATDRAFLGRDMVELDEHLHYRIVDVSSIKELCRRWYPRVYYAQPAKGLAHRALADITESIRELAYYRRAVFVPEPGPSSEEAQAAAQAVINQMPGQ